MHEQAPTNPGRLRRLAEELREENFTFDGTDARRDLALDELDYALHPAVHERRIPSYGSVVDPTVDPGDWHEPTELTVNRRAVEDLSLRGARLFADGLSSWLIRRSGGPDELVVFDRPAGSERDLVVLAESTGGTLFQRHPTGTVHAVGAFGVLRWDGIGWHRELPIAGWAHLVDDWSKQDGKALLKLLAFAVHDLGSRGIGALLVHRPDDQVPPTVEIRLPTPPPLHIGTPADLAPLRHVLGQVDGAAMFDGSGTLRQLGVRLVPSPSAESDVEALRGMRHTSGRRYSFDDPDATVIVVSEDGPVTVLRGGELIGQSDPD